MSGLKIHLLHPLPYTGPIPLNHSYLNKHKTVSYPPFYFYFIFLQEYYHSNKINVQFTTERSFASLRKVFTKSSVYMNNVGALLLRRLFVSRFVNMCLWGSMDYLSRISIIE